jgi:thiol-disulfide isomerase/thioredoxin
MKKLYALGWTAAFAFMFSPMFGQYYYTKSMVNGNPGGLNEDQEFPVGGGLTGGWNEIHPGSTATPQWSTVETLPFAFNFNGSPVTQYKVSTSGVLTFDISATTPPTSSNLSLPSNLIPNNSVMVWGLAAPGANDKIVTKTFGTAPNRQHWVSFSSYDVPSANCWTYWAIVFDESTDVIHVVDQRNAGGAGCAAASFTVGIQVNLSNFEQVTGSPNVNIQSGNNPGPDDNIYYSFIPGTRPALDMASGAVMVPNVVSTINAPIGIQAVIGNYGSTTVTNLTLNYSINGGTPVSAPVTVNLATNEATLVAHSTGWTPSGTGNVEVKFWTSMPNGSTDGNPSNDTVKKSIMVVGMTAQRRPFMEVFSSSTCPPCAPANQTFKALMDQQPAGRFNVLKYQMSWPGAGDPYFTLEAQDRRTFYSVTSVPRMQIDGEWDQHAGQVTQAILDDFRARPAFLEIAAAYQITGQRVDMQMELIPLANLSGNLRLFVAIYEKVTTQNAKNNGETVFYDIFKKFMTSSQGDPLPALIEGDNVPMSFDYTFNGSFILPPSAQQPVNHATNHTVENFNNLAVVAWVQDMTTKEVLQSTNAYFGQLGVDEQALATEEVNEIRLFPNPANNFINLDMTTIGAEEVRYQVINMVGQVVAQGVFHEADEQIHTLSTEALSNGQYVIKLNGGGVDQRIRFQVTR